VIKLKKEKKETNISQFKKLLKLLIPGIEIEYVKASLDNLRSIEMKRAEKLYEEQERRVDEFIKNYGGEDNLETEEAWQNYLEDHPWYYRESKNGQKAVFISYLSSRTG
jgi:hypothetical protein